MTKVKVDELVIDGVTYVPKETISKTVFNKEGKQAVLIRSRDAGVHFGYLEWQDFTPSGKVVTLSNTRRVYYWDGAASLSQMALDGVSKPEKCKISVILESNEIINVIETLPLSTKAVDNLYSVKIWKV
jgi:hypothetical protein